MKKEALTEKFFFLGIDGMDPDLTRKYVDEGKMPNVKKLIERGACKENLHMLGSVPNITPPMWTTVATGCNPNVHGITILEELGYTVLKDPTKRKSEEVEIDWSKTTAVASRGNSIYINLKGRYEMGIVDPKDKYDLEERIIDDLYKYKDPATGRRIVYLCMRNKEAELVGMNGADYGDIIYWLNEGFNRGHGDSFPTFKGVNSTSVSPIVVFAGKGIKSGVYTDRAIREVDLAPTAAYLLGLRMPAQCEGAPVYQIIDEEGIC